jgi:hypothetical protein
MWTDTLWHPLSPQAFQQRRAFQAMAGMFPGRGAATQLPGKDASPAPEQGEVCRTSQSALSRLCSEPLGSALSSGHRIPKIHAEDAKLLWNLSQCCSHMNVFTYPQRPGCTLCRYIWTCVCVDKVAPPTSPSHSL